MLLRLLFEWLFKPQNTSDAPGLFKSGKSDSEAKGYFGLAPQTPVDGGGAVSGGATAQGGSSSQRKPFALLVTRLANDPDGSLSATVFGAVDNRRDTSAKLIEGQPPAGDALSNLNAVLGQCWRWIDDSGADIAIWGKVDESTLRLRFIPNDAAAEGETSSLSLAASIVVPKEFDESSAALIHAIAVAAIVPQNKAQEEARFAMLAAKRKMLQDHLARPDHVAETKLAICSALSVIALRMGDQDLTREIADQLSGLIAALSRDEHGISWGLANRLLGDAQWHLSSEVKDIPGLEKAVAYYRAVGDDQALRAIATEWAEAHARLGKVYYKLALNKPDMSLLKNAVAAYNGALTVFKKGMFPQRWADIQSGVAQALMAYGEGTGNGEIMAQAAEVLKAVLTIRNRNTHPLQWAAAQNNLGAAAFALAKLSNDVAALRQAQESFSLALEIYRATDATRLIHVTNSNLMRVERLIDTWDARQTQQSKQSAGGSPTTE